jgi:hypothetical protein
VAIESPDGHVEAIQIKSGLDTNPVANKAVDFWKTSVTGSMRLKATALDPKKASFILHVETPRLGAICKRFSNAHTEGEVSAEIIATRDELWGTAASRSLAPHIAPA